jgi:hypothetical protein
MPLSPMTWVEFTIGMQSNGDSGSATAGSRARGSVATVAQITLDSALSPELSPTLLKIDVEASRSACSEAQPRRSGMRTLY